MKNGVRNHTRYFSKGSAISSWNNRNLESSAALWVVIVTSQEQVSSRKWLYPPHGTTQIQRSSTVSGWCMGENWPSVASSELHNHQPYIPCLGTETALQHSQTKATTNTATPSPLTCSGRALLSSQMLHKLRTKDEVRADKTRHAYKRQTNSWVYVSKHFFGSELCLHKTQFVWTFHWKKNQTAKLCY